MLVYVYYVPLLTHQLGIRLVKTKLQPTTIAINGMVHELMTRS